MAIRSQLTRSSFRRSGSGGGGGGGGTINNVLGVDGIIITNPTGPTVTVGQTNVAKWTVGLCRVYAVDGVNGNDANLGYADPATSSAADYAIACAAAGAVAKKTFAGLAAIFPTVGGGRTVEVVIAAGTYTGSPADFCNGTEGYVSFTVRGTGTNATAGSVAFAGTTQDVTFVGAATAAGLNAAGYNPNGSISTSSIQCVKAGGGAPGFGAEPAEPLGERIRFNSTTTTAGLRNVCRQVSAVPASDVVQTQTAEPALPVASDVFYAETPGVITGSATFNAANPGVGIQFVGIAFGSNFFYNSGRAAAVAFCVCGSFSATTPDRIGISQTYTHPVLGSITVGGGLRCTSTATVSTGIFTFAGLVCATQFTVTTCLNFSWGAGCVARNISVANVWLRQSTDTSTAPNFGVPAATSVGIPHTFGNVGTGGSLDINGSSLTVGNLQITGAGAGPAWSLKGKNNIMLLGSITGSTGNNDVGLDLQNAYESEISILATAAPTVTGTAGNIRLSGQALNPWTNLQFEEVWDISSNHLFQQVTNGEYRHRISPSVVLGVVNNAAPMAAYTAALNTGTNLQVKYASANSLANATGFAGVLEAGANDGAAVMYTPGSGFKVCQFDAAPVVGGVVYLSNTAGQFTTTVPPLSLTAAKLRIGVCVGNSFPGNLGIVRMNPESQPVLADGLP